MGFSPKISEKSACRFVVKNYHQEFSNLFGSLKNDFKGVVEEVYKDVFKLEYTMVVSEQI